MIIQTDEEGGKVIKALCDVALKVHGLESLGRVSQILKSTKLIKPRAKKVT